MNTKILFGILLFLFSGIGFTSCDKAEDDGSRGFMHKATITGDSVNGFYCHLDGGGLVVSQDRWLAGIERGYFSFNFNERDWSTTADRQWYIVNARVYPYSVYEVLRPISWEEAENKHITHPDSCSVPPLFTLGRGYRGYFDLNTGLSVMNSVNGEKISVRLNMVYDPERQTPDTLRLHFYYNPRVPASWTKTSFDYGSASCDISSLANLKQWNDSVIIVVETKDEIKHLTKISKTDFLKPTGK